MSQNQQWLSDTNIKIGSPYTSRQLKTCLSFASIKHHKILQQLQTPRHNLKRIQVAYRTNQKQNKQHHTNTKIKPTHRPKQSTSTSAIKQKQKQTQKQKQNNKIIIQSYQIQNQSLKQTVQILKQQIQTLNSSYQTLRQHHKNLKQNCTQLQNKLKQSQNQIQIYKNKQKQFQGIMPKIQELQQLQDVMIQENGKLKDREAILKDLLAEIVVITGNNIDDTAIQVRQLIQDRCRKLN